MKICVEVSVAMDAKDLRTECAVNERNNDGKYGPTGTVLQCTKNKTYQDIGSNPSSKVGSSVARPCAVIGPDRVVPPAADNYLKKASVEPWPYHNNGYRRPPEYPHKIADYQNQSRNISPRQTYQENMQRIMVPPSYGSIKINEEFSQTDRNGMLPSKQIKLNVPSESKYCEVPYTVNNNNTANDQKTIRNPEISVSNVNPAYPQPASHAWSPGSDVSRPSRIYGASDLYQYPDYPSCAGPRPVPISRPHRTAQEDPGYMFPEPYYQDANIKIKPYPSVKERYPQTRYEHINNYSNPFYPAPYLPPHKYELHKPMPAHPYPTFASLKGLDNRTTEPMIEGYHRHMQLGNYNMPFRNQVIHPPYTSVITNCSQNKMPPYISEIAPKIPASNKSPYDSNGNMYIDYENTRLKAYPSPENFYSNDMRLQPIRNQVVMPNYPPINMHQIAPHQYYKKDGASIKNYEYVNHFNPMSRYLPHFSPGAIAISPTNSNVSIDTAQTQSTLHEDCGYVSQSSGVSVKSMDSGINRSNDCYRRYYDPRYRAVVRTSPMLPKHDLSQSSSLSSKDKKQIDVRQYLQMWSDGDDENGENNANKDVTVHSLSDTHHLSKPRDSAHNQEQLYVLGLVNVPSEELSKYEHIQTVSKLPENIKGYNSIELLNQFEEVIESSNMNYYKPNTHKENQTSLKPNVARQVPRPLSPLDVEAKISQSVIHKEVGCNFEIKPCSPKMLNVELATPVQNILNERAIEKVTNPLSTILKVNSPIIKLDDNIDNCNILNNQSHSLLSENVKTPSCKMVNSQYSNSMDHLKTNYSLQDLESNSGVCLSSLPRLDNDIELNFPEVNQQFINANKSESVVPAVANDLPQLDTIDKNQETEIKETKAMTQHYNVKPEKQFMKLSKFRKNKMIGLEVNDECSQPKIIRTDSVIIKNPENVKNDEENSEHYPIPKILNKNQPSPINLTSQCSDKIVNDPESIVTVLDQNDERDVFMEVAIDFSFNKNNNSSSLYKESADGYSIENNSMSEPLKANCELDEATISVIQDITAVSGCDQSDINREINTENRIKNEHGINTTIIEKNKVNSGNTNPVENIILLDEIRKEKMNTYSSSTDVETKTSAKDLTLDRGNQDQCHTDLINTSVISLTSTIKPDINETLDHRDIGIVNIQQEAIPDLQEIMKEADKDTQNKIENDKDVMDTENHEYFSESEKHSGDISLNSLENNENLRNSNENCTDKAEYVNETDSQHQENNIYVIKSTNDLSENNKLVSVNDKLLADNNQNSNKYNKNITENDEHRIVNSSKLFGTETIGNSTENSENQHLIKNKENLTDNNRNLTESTNVEDDETRIIAKFKNEKYSLDETMECNECTPSNKNDSSIGDVFEINNHGCENLPYNEKELISMQEPNNHAVTEDNLSVVSDIQQPMSEIIDSSHSELTLEAISTLGENQVYVENELEVKRIVYFRKKLHSPWIQKLITYSEGRCIDKLTKLNDFLQGDSVDYHQNKVLTDSDLPTSHLKHIITIQDYINSDKIVSRETDVINNNSHLVDYDSSDTDLSSCMEEETVIDSKIDIACDEKPQSELATQDSEYNISQESPQLLCNDERQNTITQENMQETFVLNQESCTEISEIENGNIIKEKKEAINIGFENNNAMDVDEGNYQKHSGEVCAEVKVDKLQAYDAENDLITQLTTIESCRKISEIENDNMIIENNEDLNTCFENNSALNVDKGNYQEQSGELYEEVHVANPVADGVENDLVTRLKTTESCKEISKIENDSMIIKKKEDINMGFENNNAFNVDDGNYQELSGEVSKECQISKSLTDDVENDLITQLTTIVPRPLKRSLSDSALNNFNEDLKYKAVEDIPFMWQFKRKKISDSIINSNLVNKNICNIINSNRRNSISSIYNEDNVSFCILIDNHCLITEDESQVSNLCYTEFSQSLFNEVPNDSTIAENTDSIMDLVPSQNQDETNCEYSDPYVMEINQDKSIETSWVDDVAYVETVVSDDIAEDIVISTSPSSDYSSDNEESEAFCAIANEHTDIVKHIYGDKMCQNDADLVETLYNTPQMDVNKTLINRESQGSEECDRYYDKESLERVLSESNSQQGSPYLINHTEAVYFSQSPHNKENIASFSPIQNERGYESPLNNLDSDQDEAIDIQIGKIEYKNQEDSQGCTVHSCESSFDDVFSFKQQNDSNDDFTSSSPEVSSTTSEEKSSSILLKITNYKGSVVSQISDYSSEITNKRGSFTEEKESINSNDTFYSKKPLITKAAQKYIPPLKETICDLKVKLPLPPDSLKKLKQMKITKEEPKRLQSNTLVSSIPKNPKPKFEDVLKSIDEIQFKMHKENSKKTKKTIPKVVIKKSITGSHYASTKNKAKYNPDLTGRKWQPWVFIEKNPFIDKMAIKKNSKAIFSHRKNMYVLAEKFYKYKSVNSATFVITQPSFSKPSSGQLKYTIRLKHSY